MTQHDDRVYFSHMLDAAQEAFDLISTVDRFEFDHSRVLQLAISHLVEIVGEAARRVSPEGRERHPEIPWSEIIGMRHRIAHDYLNVKVERIWYTAVDDLPALISQLNALLPTDPSE